VYCDESGREFGEIAKGFGDYFVCDGLLKGYSVDLWRGNDGQWAFGGFGKEFGDLTVYNEIVRGFGEFDNCFVCGDRFVDN
jgi:hypothetical protein